MRVSRRNSGFTALLLLGASFACTTSSYRADTRDFRTEIQVTPDRVFVECEDIKDHENASDPDGNFGFMIHVLDEEDTVLSVIQGNVIGRKDCLERQAAINKILRDGKSIYIGGHGTLDPPRKREKLSYSPFPKRGTFYDNGRVLQFSVIQNEHGNCYSAYDGAEPPCMPEEFPIKNWP